MDFLSAKQELVLDQSFHIDVAFNDSFEKFREIGALRFLVFSPFNILWSICVDAGRVRVDRFIAVSRG